MNDQTIDQRLAAHAADYMAYVLSCRDERYGVTKCGPFQFRADDILIEVFDVKRGMDDGADGCAWRITDEATGWSNGRSEECFGWGQAAAFQAWIAFTMLVRLLHTNERPKRWQDYNQKALDMLKEAFDVGLKKQRGTLQ